MIGRHSRCSCSLSVSLLALVASAIALVSEIMSRFNQSNGRVTKASTSVAVPAIAAPKALAVLLGTKVVMSAAAIAVTITIKTPTRTPTTGEFLRTLGH